MGGQLPGTVAGWGTVGGDTVSARKKRGPAQIRCARRHSLPRYWAMVSWGGRVGTNWMDGKNSDARSLSNATQTLESSLENNTEFSIIFAFNN